MLLSNGDIVFNSLSALMRLNVCSGKPVWILDRWVDHSTELDSGGNLWVQSLDDGAHYENEWLKERLRDDQLLHITPDGEILESKSFSKILIDNGFKSLLFGTADISAKFDPIHINEIQPALEDGVKWKKGDLLISARNLSTLFIYRPDNGKIIWHKTGPWMNQHSAQFVDYHTISVFDNNIIIGPPDKFKFLTAKETNRVLIYDFITDKYSEPYAELLSIARPTTSSQGRAQILHDGGLFLEETDHGRQLRFTKKELLWSRINDYDALRIGNIGWGRYLTEEEVSTPIAALKDLKCSNANQ